MNERTHLLSSHDKLEEEFTTEDFSEKEYLNFYDSSLQIYQQKIKNDWKMIFIDFAVINKNKYYI